MTSVDKPPALTLPQPNVSDDSEEDWGEQSGFKQPSALGAQEKSFSEETIEDRELADDKEEIGRASFVQRRSFRLRTFSTPNKVKKVFNASLNTDDTGLRKITSIN